MKTFKLDKILEKEGDEYEKYIRTTIGTVLNNYSLKNEIIKFTFNGKEYKCKYSVFIIQLIFIIPFIENKKFINFTEDYIELDEIQKFDISTTNDYFNKIIMNFQSEIRQYSDEGFIESLNKSYKKILNLLSEYSGKFNIYSGTSLNLYDLFMLYDSNPTFKKLLNQKVPKNLDFSEVDSYIKTEFGSMMDILREEDTCFRPYFQSKTGMNEKQFKEIISHIGLKADLQSNIIPRVIQNSFIQGLDNITDYYIISILSRKALITSHKRVKDSGSRWLEIQQKLKARIKLL